MTDEPAAPVGAQTHITNYGEVSLDLIDPNPEQPRLVFDKDELEALAESIRANGVIQPIVIQAVNGRYIIHDGERRTRAARLAGLERIPANIIISSSQDTKDLLIRAIVANDQRADLSAIERAKGYQKLADEHGLSDAEIARQVGKSRSVVANTRRLLGLPEERQQQVSSGELSERQALALLPLYQLPQDIQEKVSEHYYGRSLTAAPQKLSSDAIRSNYNNALDSISKKIEFDPEAVFEGNGIYRSACAGCDYCHAKGDERRCLNPDCLQIKTTAHQRAYLEQASAATGLPYCDQEVPYHDRDSFYGQTGAKALEIALAKPCPRLHLIFSPFSTGPEGFDNVGYSCIHPGQKHCACAKAIEAQEKAAEKERTAELEELRKQVRAHLVGLIRATPPAVLKVTVYIEKRYETTQNKCLDMTPEKLAGELAEVWMRHNLTFNPMRGIQATRTDINIWLKKMGLPAMAGEDRRPEIENQLDRIERWYAETDAFTVEALRGNLANLAKLAEAGLPNDLAPRFDGLKRNLLYKLAAFETPAPAINGLDAINKALADPNAKRDQLTRHRKYVADEMELLVNSIGLNGASRQLPDMERILDALDDRINNFRYAPLKLD